MAAVSRRSLVLAAAGAVLAPVRAAGVETEASVATAVAPIGALAVARLGAQQEALLSGRVFVVATGKTDAQPSGQDVVRFTGGLISTDLCDRFGFRPAPYHLRAEAGALHVMAALASDAQGELRFSGRIFGDRLVAQADWRRQRWYGDVHLRIWFDGALADPAGDHPAWLE